MNFGITLGALVGGLMMYAACDGGDPYWDGDDVDLYCRDFPQDCPGDIGGDCAFDEDCSDGACCRDSHCGRGTCTYLCRGHADCPPEMLCEHGGYCFFRCSHDADCGPGQRCEHGHSICEYP
jgi:hypothetical protein